MKVQVVVKIACKGEMTSTLDTLNIIVSPSDTILNVKSRISDVVRVPFPEQEIFFSGEVVSNKQHLADCNIKEGDCLEFICTATTKAFVQQLSDLLGAQALSPEELSLLYSLRHGMTVSEALKALGRKKEKLEDFMLTQKVFALKRGLVTVVDAAKPSELTSIQEDNKSGKGKVEVSIAITVQGAGQIIEDTADMVLDNSDTVAQAKEHITAVGQVPFPDQHLYLGDKLLSDAEKLCSYGISHGAQLALKARASEDTLVQRLKDLVHARTAITANDLSLEYCNRYGVPVIQALKVLGLPRDLRKFLEYHQDFSLKGNCVIVASALELEVPPPQTPVRVLMTNIMDRVVAATAFLNVQRMEQSFGPQSGEVTIFVNGLLGAGKDRWLRGLLHTLTASLTTSSTDDFSYSCSIKVEGDVVQVLKEGFPVRLRLCPATVA